MRVRWFSRRASHLLVVEGGPVQPSVPLVLLDVFRTVLQVADPFRTVRSQQPTNQIFGVDVKVTWELELARQYLLIDTEWVLVKVWRIPL